MCGISGYFYLDSERRPDAAVLVRMADSISHRGPDASGYYVKDRVGLGFRRLSLIDLEGGNQPLFNEDHSIALICNGEIYNYRELRSELLAHGHRFRTNTDVEVLIHLYEDYGIDFLNRLNGQFAFALYDGRQRQLFLVRDQFGINPLYYTVVDETLIFGSEIKAILAHPLVRPEVDLSGLDQVLTFPGLVSPRTMFKGIESLKSGHYVKVSGGDMVVCEYWDLDYPRLGEADEERAEAYYIDGLAERLLASVKYRLHADVPVGFYLSGGLDSSLIAALIHELYPDNSRHSFSIDFADKAFSESKHQRLMAAHAGSTHHEMLFDWNDISERLQQVILHSECPLKESYNTANLALSAAVRRTDVTAILTGEGADELFAGYIGYRFDALRQATDRAYSIETILEDDLRMRLWGDENLLYEKDYAAYSDTRQALYSDDVNEQFSEFDCLNFEPVNKHRVAGRHPIHQRSYLDFKLRMADHLLSDHGDKMAMANSIEARYPFLDPGVVDFARRMPPHLKLNGFVEKYALRRVADRYVPREIARREKYAFVAPGSQHLLRQRVDWVMDMLSFDRIKREGYFNPATVERLKTQYLQDGFRLNIPYDSDLLIIVLTFGIFLETFMKSSPMPSLVSEYAILQSGEAR